MAKKAATRKRKTAVRKTAGKRRRRPGSGGPRGEEGLDRPEAHDLEEVAEARRRGQEGRGLPDPEDDRGAEGIEQVERGSPDRARR